LLHALRPAVLIQKEETRVAGSINYPLCSDEKFSGLESQSFVLRIDDAGWDSFDFNPEFFGVGQLHEQKQ